MIRLALFIVFFLWVVRAPFAYRDSIRDSVLNRSPEIYLPKQEREKSQAFIYASQHYKPGDPKRIKAISDLALVRWQQLLFDDAEKLYTMLLNENKTASGFNQKQEEAMLHIATLLDVGCKFDQAILAYMEILDYDKKYFPIGDVHIARDYNNLGLSTYLKALSKQKGVERTRLLKQASDFYKQALQIYRRLPQAQQAIAVVLCNEQLASRDLNE
jgi:tetratricopeptide (TPR) repeat protein